MSKRASVYMQDKMMEVLDRRNTSNTSESVNKFVCRYDVMIRRDIPLFSSEEFLEIFSEMWVHRFTTDVHKDVELLPMHLESNGVSSAIVEKVKELSFEHRIALIDLIERSQSGVK